MSNLAAVRVPERLFAVWHNWVYTARIGWPRGRQMRKKQLKRELAKKHDSDPPDFPIS